MAFTEDTALKSGQDEDLFLLFSDSGLTHILFPEFQKAHRSLHNLTFQFVLPSSCDVGTSASMQ